MRHLRAGLLALVTAATLGGCYEQPGYYGYGYGRHPHEHRGRGYHCRRVWVPGTLYRAGYYRCA